MCVSRIHRQLYVYVDYKHILSYLSVHEKTQLRETRIIIYRRQALNRAHEPNQTPSSVGPTMRRKLCAQSLGIKLGHLMGRALRMLLA